ncbi:hypothetical protein IKF15_01145 [Candidatus Saccharibacteria bacterium]|nr:hypothetical protein [Candidatus Saccharibacteria bacterium]
MSEPEKVTQGEHDAIAELFEKHQATIKTMQAEDHRPQSPSPRSSRIFRKQSHKAATTILATKKQDSTNLKSNDKSISSPESHAPIVEPRRDEEKIRRKGKFLVGQTIAGEARDRRDRELEHIRLRKEHKRKKLMIIGGLCLLVVLVLVVAVDYITGVFAEREAARREAEHPTPTVEIIDENSTKKISTRTQEFIARLEADIKEYGLVIERVVLPRQKAREVLVYIRGRSEYYKTTIDRSSAVQAEDLARMTKYLDSRGIHCGYVDLRVEGKAFYR